MKNTITDICYANATCVAYDWKRFLNAELNRLGHCKMSDIIGSYAAIVTYSKKTVPS